MGGDLGRVFPIEGNEEIQLCQLFRADTELLHRRTEQAVSAGSKTFYESRKVTGKECIHFSAVSYPIYRAKLYPVTS